MPSGAGVVTGFIVFGAALAAADATLHVVVEDVSRADAAAQTAARFDLPLPGPIDAGAALPFTIEVRTVDSGKSYSVRAHVDRGGDGIVKPGDLVSTRSHPVLTHGAPDRVRVEVHRVEP